MGKGASRGHDSITPHHATSALVHRWQSGVMESVTSPCSVVHHRWVRSREATGLSYVTHSRTKVPSKALIHARHLASRPSLVRTPNTTRSPDENGPRLV